MTNFIEALTAGLSAADELDRQKREIIDVVTDASNQLLTATGGAISIRIEPRVKKLGGMTIEHYVGMCFHSEKDGIPHPVLEICRWVTNQGGYPVKLQYDDQEASCYDREALERGVVGALASPTAGRRLRIMLDELNASLNPAATGLGEST